MERRNPWLTDPEEEEAPVEEERNPDEEPPPITGPTDPQEKVDAPLVEDQLSCRNHSEQAELWWLGVHGGAGESSLAALVDGWPSAEHSWPMASGVEESRVVLVARTNLRGLRAAQSAAKHWASGELAGINVLGLVLVADAPGKTPKPLRELAEVVAGGVPRVWRLPWIEAWRTEEPTLEGAPRKVRKLVRDLETITTESA